MGLLIVVGAQCLQRQLQVFQPGELARVEKLITEIDEIVQCDKVTGDDAFVCRMHLRGIEELDHCLRKIASFATTSTSIVKSTLVSNRLLPLDGAD